MGPLLHIEARLFQTDGIGGGAATDLCGTLRFIALSIYNDIL